MKKILVLITSITLLTACSNKEKEEMLKQVNELEKQYDETEKVIADIDTGYWNVAAKGFSKRWNYLKDTLAEIELTFHDADVASQYRNMRKVVGRYKEHMPILVNEMDSSQKQLADLKHDIEHGLVDQEKFTSYMEVERSNYRELNTEAKELYSLLDPMREKIERLNPSVDSLIERSRQFGEE